MSNDPSVEGNHFSNVRVKEEVRNQDKILIKEEPKEEEEISNCNIHTSDKATQKNFVSIYFSYFLQFPGSIRDKGRVCYLSVFSTKFNCHQIRSHCQSRNQKDIKSILIEIDLRKANGFSEQVITHITRLYIFLPWNRKGKSITQYPVFYWLMFKFMRFYIHLLIKHNQFSFFWLERLDFKHANVNNCALHNSSGCNLKRFPSRNIRTRILRVSWSKFVYWAIFS